MRIRCAILFSVLLLSCTPQQRLSHLLKRHPELVKTDTIFLRDTIRISESNVDTIFKNTVTKDTVIIKQDRLTIKYFNSRDSIFISGKCDSIIKIIEVPVVVNKAEYIEKQTKWWDWVVRALLVFFAGGAFFLFILLRVK